MFFFPLILKIKLIAFYYLYVSSQFLIVSNKVLVPDGIEFKKMVSATSMHIVIEVSWRIFVVIERSHTNGFSCCTSKEELGSGSMKVLPLR